MQAGSIVYVAKNVEHRFHSIEKERRAEFIEALTVIVFTSTGSVQASRQQSIRTDHRRWKIEEGYFVGRCALEREKKEGSLWKLMGLEVEWEGMERLFKDVGLPPQIPGMAVRGSLPIFVGNVQVGYASTSTWSPVLKKYIALAHLQKPYFEIGTDVRMEITVEHPRQHAPAKVVKLPFYEPPQKRSTFEG